MLRAQQLLARLPKVLRNLFRRWLLLIEHTQHHARSTRIDRPRNPALRQAKSRRGLAGHRAHIRHLPILTHQVARLHRNIHLRRRLAQIARRLRSLIQLLQLRAQHLRYLLLPVVRQDVVAIRRKLRRVGRPYVRHLKHRKSIARRNRLRLRALVHRERLGQQLRPIRNSRHNSVLRDVVGHLDVQTLRRGGLVQPIFLRQVHQLPRKRLLRRTGALLLQNRQNLRLDLGDRPRVRRLLFFHLQNVVTKLRLDHIRRLPGIQRERRLIELRHGLPAVQPPQLATLHLAPRIIRVLPCQIREVCSTLDLLQQILRLRLRSRILRRVPRRRRNQDVPYPHLLLHLVLRLVLVVVDLHLRVRHGRLPAWQIVRVEGHILNLPALRDRGLVPCLILLEKVLQLRVRRIDRASQLIRRDHRVVEFHLRPLHPLRIPHRVIRNRHASRDQRLQPVQFHIVLYLLLKVRPRRLEC